MDSPFYKFFIKSQGTVVGKPLVNYYFLMSSFYSNVVSTVGFVHNLIKRDSVYDTCKIGERVPALNVVRDVEDMLNQHGLLDSTNSDKTYNSQNHPEEFQLQFSNVKKDKFLKQPNLWSDADTTFMTDDYQMDDELSLSDLDEFVTLMNTFTDSNVFG